MEKSFFTGPALQKIEAEVLGGISRKEIYLSRTSGVYQIESDAVKHGIGKIISEIGSTLNLKDFGNFNQGKGDFESADWYQNQSIISRDRGFGQQVCASKIDTLLHQEPHQRKNPHYDFFLVDRDMTLEQEQNNNFIFGLGPYPNNIVSVKRFREYIKDESLKLLSLSVLAAHEVTHNFDLVRRNFNVGTQGYHRGHCMGESGPCLMQQVNVGGRTINQLAMEIIDKDSWLCQDCTDEIQAKKSYLLSKGIII